MRAEFLSLKGIKLRLIKVILIFIAILFVFLTLYFPHYTKLNKLKQANCQVRRRINELKVEIEDLEKKIKREREDSVFLEKFVRNELNSAKQGEIVVDILE